MILKHSINRLNNNEQAKKIQSPFDCKPGQIESSPEYCFKGLKTKTPYKIYY
ncbi:MAG: hypothetical protein QW739_05760 [Candidatus Odinarchaeota archaeon]